MKNIFSQLGTKKVAGAVLVGATLLVGIGVVSNFSGGSQKAANEAALSRFGNSAYNTVAGGSSASRADLERQMSASQERYTARFLKGQSDGLEADEAFSSDGAYAEGVRGGESSPYGANGVNGAYGPDGAYSNGDYYQAMGSTYEEVIGENGEYDNNSASRVSANGERQFQSAQDAVASAAKGGKGTKGKNGQGGAVASGQAGRVRGATQVNKLSASSGGSAFGSGGAGGGYSGSFGGSAARGGDSNSQALPQNNVPANTGDSQAFKFGRAGGIGGNNVNFSGREVKGGQSRGIGVNSDLQLAAAYSNKAVVSSQDVGQKSLAEAAFDGSNPEDIGTTIEEGASIGKVASELGKGLNIGDIEGPDLEPVRDNLEEIARQNRELAALQKKISDKLLGMIIAVAAMAVGLFFLVKAAYSAPWPANLILFIAAAVLSTAALLTIAGCLWWGDDSIVNMIKQMGDNEKFGLVNQGVDVGGKLTNTYILSAELVLLLGLCWIPWGNISSASEIVQLLAKGAASTLIGNVVQGGISEGVNNSNVNKQVKSYQKQSSTSKQGDKNEP